MPWTPLDRLLASACDLRVAIVAAHADDEAIGIGARLPSLRDAHLIHVTDGSPRDLGDARAAGFDNRDDYADARRREVIAALALAGLGPERSHALGFVDQEASLDLAGVALRLADLLAALRPDLIVTHAYEGGHPDHDATAFGVHAACALLERRGPAAPAVVEMTCYHAGPSGIVFAEFLPAEGCAVASATLAEEDRAFKRRLLDAYVTQRRLLVNYPIGTEERFRTAPRYQFSEPPHAGRLWYENFAWGMTGPRWRESASGALERLGVSPRL